MFSLIDSLIGETALLPHGQCLLWETPLIALHAVSDALIALAYFAIPLAIVIFVRRRPGLEPLHLALALLFAVFIVACGLSHISSVVTLWIPAYLAQGLIKAATALVSLVTAFVLFALIPRLLAIPSPAELREANRRLGQEAALRQGMVEDLIVARADLERRVEERTRAAVKIMENFEVTLRGSAVTIYQQDLDLRYTWIHNLRPPLVASDYIGRTPREALPPEAAAVIEPFQREILRTGVKDRLIVAISRGLDEGVWYDIQSEPLRDDAGVISGLASVAVDITSQKAGEQQLRVLMRELTHRSKNLLAVVQGIARQSATNVPDVQTFTERFGARLQALGESHDILVSTDWRGAAIPDLARAHLGHFLAVSKERLTLRGPDILLSPEATQQIGLALHELSTNAAKYGALSNDGGRVEITWETRPSPRGVDLALIWREIDGPPVVPSERTGFGHIMVTYLVPRSLRGTATLTPAAEGMLWTLTFPLFIRQDPDPPATPTA
ncbi:histidine kinase [Rhodospirillum rubrum]|uniref:sensor histidine kinase n=1 Tax=Rhodospirillum rubrum TaxID=1085 RepID=UPI001907C856|nr:PAS domain-containing sensor histidine kinase [Rhodospirillum rubrum]MBK1663635.1 histidine kinase [Rhodospirillum rubrum]MBK1676983.1 histidine kinase [Rhodospirillum rubrum]